MPGEPKKREFFTRVEFGHNSPYQWWWIAVCDRCGWRGVKSEWRDNAERQQRKHRRWHRERSE